MKRSDIHWGSPMGSQLESLSGPRLASWLESLSGPMLASWLAQQKVEHLGLLMGLLSGQPLLGSSLECS